MASPREWYDNLPIVTKVWFSSAVGFALLGRFGLLDPRVLILAWSKVTDDFQIWRLVTNFAFFGLPSFGWLMTVYFLATLVPAYEDDPMPSGGGSRRGNLADVVYMLMVCGLFLLGCGYLLNLFLLSTALFVTVVYVWSKRAGDTPVSFYMFRIPARYLPWAMLGMAIVLNGDPIPDLLGIAAGHIYYFLQEVAPSSETPLKGMRLLATPAWLYKLLSLPPTDEPAVMGRMHREQAAARAAGGAPAGRTYFAGQGRVLGRD